MPVVYHQIISSSGLFISPFCTKYVISLGLCLHYVIMFPIWLEAWIIVPNVPQGLDHLFQVYRYHEI